MSFVINEYKKSFIQRFDKDLAIPYYSYKDFPGLSFEESSFTNSLGVEIHYFFYAYDGYNKEKIVLFCHGLDCGHTAYLAEIETLCKAGFRVLTLDYTGCGVSKGEDIYSANRPTLDVIELMNHLHLNEEIVLVGHSLGGYTALNVINKTPEIHKAVILAGFIDLSSEMIGFVKLRFLANKVKRYEEKMIPEFKKHNNWKYLKNTSDKLLFFHSLDDTMVPYKHNAGKVLKIKNPNITVITCDKKKHNPSYSYNALDFMNTTMGTYNYLLANGELKTLEERKEYFKDKPISKMTAQDEEVFKKIIDFIRE